LVLLSFPVLEFQVKYLDPLGVGGGVNLWTTSSILKQRFLLTPHFKAK
jgi:hypothetical protein